MKTLRPWLFALLLVAAGCGDTAPDAYNEGMAGSTPEDAMTLAVTTTDATARAHFNEGLHAWDMQRFIDAREHFEQAIEADENFALAHLYLANASNSLQEFTQHLEAAEAVADGASEDEQALIEMARQGFRNDIEGQLVTAGQLVQRQPESARARLLLAGILTNLNRHGEARAALQKAIELAPEMAAAHMQLGNSYLFSDPKDLEMARQHMQHAVDLEPEEFNTHDLLGDAYRAQGEFEKSRDAYTMAAQYSGDDGSPYQQRGHVNTFLGNYDAARADYDKSISMARANQAPSYGVYRAYASVHEGKPEAAIEELKELVAKIDAMDIPEPTGLKLFALGSAGTIALHHGMTDAYETLLADWTTLMRAQADQVNTDEFRRNQEAAIANAEARLLIEKGDYAAAEAKVDEIATLVEPNANPRKMEPVHELQGLIALEQDQFEDAAMHLRQANHANNMMVKYRLAQALEGAGATDEAMALYKDIANYNFNSVNVALIRKDAIAKASMTTM